MLDLIPLVLLIQGVNLQTDRGKLLHDGVHLYFYRRGVVMAGPHSIASLELTFEQNLRSLRALRGM